MVITAEHVTIIETETVLMDSVACGMCGKPDICYRAELTAPPQLCRSCAVTARDRYEVVPAGDGFRISPESLKAIAAEAADGRAWHPYARFIAAQ